MTLPPRFAESAHATKNISRLAQFRHLKPGFSIWNCAHQKFFLPFRVEIPYLPAMGPVFSHQVLRHSTSYGLVFYL